MGGILSSVKGIKKVNSAVAGFAEVLISYSLPLEQGILPSASHLLLCGLLCCFGEAEIAIMVIPVIPKRTFLRKLISLLSNWEPQAELCHVLALGAAVRLIPLILSALITTPCAPVQPFAQGAVFPLITAQLGLFGAQGHSTESLSSFPCCSWGWNKGQIWDLLRMGQSGVRSLRGKNLLKKKNWGKHCI